MPSHQNRRTPLPKDYQFGDMGKPTIAESVLVPLTLGDIDLTLVLKPWRPHHENAAEQLARRGEYNVIEGEHE